MGGGGYTSFGNGNSSGGGGGYGKGKGNPLVSLIFLSYKTRGVFHKN